MDSHANTAQDTPWNVGHTSGQGAPNVRGLSSEYQAHHSGRCRRCEAELGPSFNDPSARYGRCHGHPCQCAPVQTFVCYCEAQEVDHGIGVLADRTAAQLMCSTSISRPHNLRVLTPRTILEDQNSYLMSTQPYQSCDGSANNYWYNSTAATSQTPVQVHGGTHRFTRSDTALRVSSQSQRQQAVAYIGSQFPAIIPCPDDAWPNVTPATNTPMHASGRRPRRSRRRH